MKINQTFSIALILLITLGTGTGIYTYHYYQNQSNPIQMALNHITVGLDVKAYHSGQSIPFTERNLPDDLVLDNFNYMIIAMFTPYNGANVQFPAVSTTNMQPSLCTKGCNAFTAQFVSGNSYCNVAPYCGGMIEIGTSAAAPARTDYKMGSQYGADTSTSASACNTGATDTITFSGAVAITSGTTITEAGGVIGMTSSSQSNYHILMFHDTFAGIAAINGDTVTILYTISLNNSGFNTNFCAILAGLFTGSVNNGNYPNGYSLSLTPIGGGSQTYYLWCNNHSFFSYIATTTNCGETKGAGDVYLAIGTSGSAFSPASNQLGAQVYSNALAAETYSSTNGRLYFTTTFSITGSATIQEAGLFITLGATNYMILGTTFLGIAVVNGNSLGTTIQITD